MYKALPPVRVKSRGSVPVPPSKIQSNNIKFQHASTQTNFDSDCKAHNQQITELLTEVAIAHSHKSKLECEISNLKNYLYETEEKLVEESKRFETEANELKSDNLEKDKELSRLKISYLEEQTELLSQISNLKTQLQNSNKDAVSEHLKNDKQQLENKLATTATQLKNELEKNFSLQLKITKYKTRFRNLTSYVKTLSQEAKMKKSNDELRISKRFSSIEHRKLEPNVENMILSELFFKQSPIHDDIGSLFYKQQKY